MDASNVADAFERKITVACDFALQRKPKRLDGKKLQHWWIPKIAQLRSSCTVAKKALKRAVVVRNRNSGELAMMDHLLENLRSCKKALKTEITKSKERVCKELLETVENDVWGKPYKLVLRKLQGPPTAANMEPITLKEIVPTLFPTKASLRQIEYNHSDTPIPLFTQDEVSEAFKRMAPRRKAPGPDGLTNCILATAHRAEPTLFRGMFNKCLRDGDFPQKKEKLKNSATPQRAETSKRTIIIQTFMFAERCRKTLRASTTHEARKTFGKCTRPSGRTIWIPEGSLDRGCNQHTEGDRN
uniref:Retrovirus-related Pol polyprotein from type-1 retrotransposable element R1 n=1 Tax=Sipha flava TaxID=143950 RepID=A0A2S2R3J6_9HEMI